MRDPQTLMREVAGRTGPCQGPIMVEDHGGRICPHKEHGYTTRVRLFPQLWEPCRYEVDGLMDGDTHWRDCAGKGCPNCGGSREVVTDSLEKWLSVPEALEALVRATDAATKEA